MLEQIRNYVQLTPEIGTSGQPTPDQFGFIADAGYRAVINLALPDSDHALVNEGNIVTALKMAYVHIPVPFDQPTPEHLKLFIQMMDALENGKVWVHCVANYRVSAFLYHYLRLRKGYSQSAARSPMFEQWHPDSVWSAFLSLDSEALLM